MRLIIKILVLLIAVFQITGVLAAESIVGTWQGKLITSPDSEVAVQFIIKQEVNGSYSVVLNSLDEDRIKNIKANSVAYDSGVIKMEVAELSGSYEGILKAGKIEGKWKQEGTSFPLNLTPYEKPGLSKKDMERLLGAWQGKIAIANVSLTAVFRFEMSSKGELVGFMDSPDQGATGIPVSDIGISEGVLTMKVPSIGGEYKGKINEKEIAGELKQYGNSTPLTVKKGEYKPPVYKLDLLKETMDQLLGEWNGPLTIQKTSLTVVFRFEMTKNNEFVGFQDSPDQGAKGIPITEASLSDGKLTLKVASIGGEFKGQLSGDKLDGEWSQMGMKTPLSLKKGKYVAQVYKLILPKETADQLSGKWNGKLGPLNLAFRFEKSKTGDFIGFTDSPDQGGYNIPVTDTSFSNGKLTLKVASIGGEFIGQLSGGKLDGTWTQGGMSNPLLLTKEKP